MKLEMTQLEESLLEELASSKGNVLENQELIDSLNKTKSSSNEIAAGLKESKNLQQSLEEVMIFKTWLRLYVVLYGVCSLYKITLRKMSY